MSDVTMTIGGESRSSADWFPVVNPATEEPELRAPACTAGQLDDAMRAADAAYQEWRRDEDARRDAMRAAADALADAADEIAPILTAEHGQPLGAARGEVMGASFWLQFFADIERPREVLQDDDTAFVEVRCKPMGVVAAITPWNFPLILACWKLAPALRAGNTVVLKPSPYTPRSSLKMVEVLNEALPAGVVNAVSGDDRLGPWITSHPVPRKVSFTGSIATGRDVATRAVADFKRVTLELGGNDAAIVLDGTDIGDIAEELFWGAFLNNGQACAAVKRLYVPRALHDDTVEALAAIAKSVPVGAGTEEGTVLGPVSNRPQFERVRELVEEATEAGASVAAGGAPLDREGYFYPPTIVAGASESTRLVGEEQFGPALPVLAYDDLDEAVARANATSFGLGGSVWGLDVELALAVADRLECGTSWVNTHVALGPSQPFGGHKHSGIGVENGLLGLAGFCDVQVLHHAR